MIHPLLCTSTTGLSPTDWISLPILPFYPLTFAFFIISPASHFSLFLLHHTLPSASSPPSPPLPFLSIYLPPLLSSPLLPFLSIYLPPLLSSPLLPFPSSVFISPLSSPLLSSPSLPQYLSPPSPLLSSPLDRKSVV